MKKGFTIMEILSVLVIIGVILLIVVPSTFFIIKGINNRAYESKKEILLSAAQVYAQDRSGVFLESGVNYYTITVGDLLQSGYTEPDGKVGDNDAVINPKNKESMNEEKITIKYKNNSYSAIWGEETVVVSSADLIDKVCKDLAQMKSITGCDCNDLDDDNMCLYKGLTVANYVYYNNVYWQILGVYKDVSEPLEQGDTWPADLKIKMITEDVI